MRRRLRQLHDWQMTVLAQPCCARLKRNPGLQLCGSRAAKNPYAVTKYVYNSLDKDLMMPLKDLLIALVVIIIWFLTKAAAIL